MHSLDNLRIGVLGLGYVGLPLAVEFGRHFPTIGFDVKAARVAELRSGRDATLEVSSCDLEEASQLEFAADIEALRDCNFYIVTVPTPVGRDKRPLLSPLRSASELLGQVVAEGDIVVYESTVFPGCTEEFCLPIIEKVSGLKVNQDFFAGYSPERINPGDKEHRLPNIKKVTSGSTREIADFVDSVYGSIITAGTHKASSIKVAEAAKVIENTQRDLNIALINELAMIFDRLDIDTEEVLLAAGSKWNFLPFRPGLVGGHCIGVDPYYLTHKAQETGYHPEIILAGRRLNDGMGRYIASSIIKLMISRNIQPGNARVLMLGLSFKENCPDVRNTKVIDVVHELQTYKCVVDCYDPWVDPEEARREYSVNMIDEPAKAYYDAIVLAVAHDQFRDMGVSGIRALGAPNSVIYDVKYLLPRDAVDGRL